MGAASGNEDSLLMRAVDSIGFGATLDEAFQSLVEVLRAPLELWHASLTVLRPGISTAEFVATWSMATSVFEPGTQISTSISETVRTTTEALYDGQVVMGSVPPRPESIVLVGRTTLRVRSNQYVRGIPRPKLWAQAGRAVRGNRTPQNT